MFNCCSGNNFNQTATNQLIKIFEENKSGLTDYLVVSQASLDTVSKLLDLGANPNSVFINEKGEKTPLISFASMSGNFNLTKILLDAGSNPNTRDHAGKSCIGLLLSTNTVNFVTDDRNNEGFGQNLFADASNKLFDVEKTLNLLLEHGAKPKIFNRTKETPIQNLLFNNVVGLLTKYKFITLSEKTSLDTTNFFPKPAVSDVVTKEFDKSKTFKPTSEQSRNMIIALVNHKIDLNSKDKNGYSPLHLAVLKDDLELSKLFVLNNANVNLKSKSANNALQMAAFKGNKELVDLLLINGADAQVKDNKGRNAIDFALLGNRIDLAEYIKIKYDNLKAKPIIKDSPVMLERNKPVLALARAI